MNKLESCAPAALRLLETGTAGATGISLARRREERERRRRRTRVLAGVLLALSLAFVANGFVNPPAEPRDALAKEQSKDGDESS